jgi:hypothetical protein
VTGSHGDRRPLPHGYRPRPHNADGHAHSSEHGGPPAAWCCDLGDAVHPVHRLDGRDGGRRLARYLGLLEGPTRGRPATGPRQARVRPREPAGARERGARDALSRAVSGFLGGERVLDGVLCAARGALSGAIHAGFVLILCTTAAAIAATLLIKNLKLEDPAAAPPDDAAPDSDPALAATLAVALEADATGDEDRVLARFLRSVETSPSARPNPEGAAALRGVADRIESGNADYPRQFFIVNHSLMLLTMALLVARLRQRKTGAD